MPWPEDMAVVCSGLWAPVPDYIFDNRCFFLHLNIYAKHNLDGNVSNKIQSNDF